MQCSDSSGDRCFVVLSAVAAYTAAAKDKRSLLTFASRVRGEPRGVGVPRNKTIVPVSLLLPYPTQVLRLRRHFWRETQKLPLRCSSGRITQRSYLETNCRPRGPEDFFLASASSARGAFCSFGRRHFSATLPSPALQGLAPRAGEIRSCEVTSADANHSSGPVNKLVCSPETELCLKCRCCCLVRCGFV